jgi:hypothetical protein
LQRKRFGQIPEQLMELPHDREHLKHLHCDSPRPPPVLSAEGDLRDLLARAKAVINGTTGEALLPEAVVNGAAEVRLQIWTGLPGVLGDGEVIRGYKGRRDTTQPKTAFTISAQTQTTFVNDGCCGLKFFGQCGWFLLDGEHRFWCGSVWLAAAEGRYRVPVDSVYAGRPALPINHADWGPDTAGPQEVGGNVLKCPRLDIQPRRTRNWHRTCRLGPRATRADSWVAGVWIREVVGSADVSKDRVGSALGPQHFA